MSWIEETMSIIIKYGGRALGGPAELAKGITIATLSLAESLLEIIGSGFAEDVCKWKVSLIEERQAKATLKVAKAAEAANKNARQQHDDAVHAAKVRVELEKQKGQLAIEEYKNRKLQQEIREREQTDAAMLRIEAAISIIKQKGGGVFFSVANLKELAGQSPVPIDESAVVLTQQEALSSTIENLSREQTLNWLAAILSSPAIAIQNPNIERVIERFVGLVVKTSDDELNILRKEEVELADLLSDIRSLLPRMRHFLLAKIPINEEESLSDKIRSAHYLADYLSTMKL
jgi:predicted methyltransferase MtxX (methanogen marker protein 4)